VRCVVKPDRSDIFANWKVPDVEGGKPYRTQIIEALCRIREAEVTREQRYIERKMVNVQTDDLCHVEKCRVLCARCVQAREGSSAKRKVQPYAFAFTNSTAGKSTDAGSIRTQFEITIPFSMFRSMFVATTTTTATVPPAAPAVASDAENRLRMLEYGAFLR
jgi:hypothetical protein